MKKIAKTKTWIVVVSTGVALSFCLLFFVLPILSGRTIEKVNGDSTAQQSTAAIPLAVTVVGLPNRLIIPSLQINAPIEYVGLTDEGAMDVPKAPNRVAWFQAGPRPGEIGSAVMAGHNIWKDGRAAVFGKLRVLKTGDTIYVTDDKGGTFVFIVREIQKFDRQADATKVFRSDEALAHLNLITCDGYWNKAQQSFSKRLIVFSDLETGV